MTVPCTNGPPLPQASASPAESVAQKAPGSRDFTFGRIDTAHRLVASLWVSLERARVDRVGRPCEIAGA